MCNIVACINIRIACTNIVCLKLHALASALFAPTFACAYRSAPVPGICDRARDHHSLEQRGRIPVVEGRRSGRLQKQEPCVVDL
eukprot:scaffold247319_cov21-Tisochrysis_lutea.AAC.1